MTALGHLLNDAHIAKLADQAGSGVTKAIHKASSRTGADFAYLMEKASAESSFRTDIKAKTSSATGLFQFIDSTWLRTVKNYGAKHGMADAARHIDENGKVADPVKRQEILDLRNNPEKSALMAAELASENKRIMASRTDLTPDQIGPTELYLAHFCLALRISIRR